MSMQHQRGFNLVELMVVIALLATLAGIGVPSFREFVATQRVKNTAFDIAAVMMHAKSLATKPGRRAVSIARTGDSWSSGWAVQVGGNTVATQQALRDVTITPVDNPATASIDYRPDGRPAASVRFEIAAAGTSAKRCVTIDPLGLPKTSPASCPMP